MNIDYNDRIQAELTSEFRSYVSGLKEMSGEEAIHHAYEKVIKEEIIVCFEDGSMKLSPKQARALLAEKEPLDYLYMEWLSSDHSFSDVLSKSITDAIKPLVKEMNARSGLER